jgi:hypothetical protein
MRQLVTRALTLLVLAFATGFLWNHQFERPAGASEWGLSDLQAQTAGLPGITWIGAGDDLRMRIESRAAGDSKAFRIPLLGAHAVDGLHFAFAIRSENLKPGPKKWQDGRVFLEWHLPGERGTEDDYLTSIRHTCQNSESGFVLKSPRSGSVPALHFEHLGESGVYELGNLRITSVRQRPWWRVAACLITLMWVVWVWASICRTQAGSRPASATAAVFWTIFAILWIVPGPWKSYRPLSPPGYGTAAFDLPASHEYCSNSVRERWTAASTITAGIVEPAGEMPVQGSIFLKAKHWISSARPLLHALMLAGPALIFAFLVGNRRSVYLCALLAIGIEFSQIAFGYGFGWDDVLDLFTDGLGIAFGLWVAAWPMFRCFGCLRHDESVEPAAFGRSAKE